MAPFVFIMFSLYKKNVVQTAVKNLIRFMFGLSLNALSSSVFAIDAEPSSQDSKESSLLQYTHFSTAANFVQLVDELVVPIRHQGASGEVFMGHTVEDGVNKWNINLQAGYGVAESRLGTTAELYSFYSNVSWVKHAAYLGNLEEVSLYAGGFIQSGGKYQFYPEIDESHLYWVMQYALGLQLDFELPMQQNRRVNWRIKLPVVSALSRPLDNYLYNNDEPDIAIMLRRMNDNLSLVFPNRYIMLEGLMMFEYRLSKNLRQHIGYKIEYEQDSIIDKFQQVKHGVYLGVSAVW